MNMYNGDMGGQNMKKLIIVSLLIISGFIPILAQSGFYDRTKDIVTYTCSICGYEKEVNRHLLSPNWLIIKAEEEEISICHDCYINLIIEAVEFFREGAKRRT